jgi:hypothetical protein
MLVLVLHELDLQAMGIIFSGDEIKDLVLLIQVNKPLQYHEQLG